MPKARYPDMTHDGLMGLFRQHGTWRKVAAHLDLPSQTLDDLKARLGCGGRNDAARDNVPSSLVPYLEQIRILAEDGCTCPEIVETLNLPVQPEQVRRFCHKNNIPVAGVGSQPGEPHRDWKGGRLTDDDGYILLYMPEHPTSRKSGYIAEHRYVMEQHIGRYLLPLEVVHHKNNVKDDNRIENLELFDENGIHLAVTLKGQVPQWTEDGKRRISEGVSRYQQDRWHGASSSRDLSGSDDPSSL